MTQLKHHLYISRVLTGLIESDPKESLMTLCLKAFHSLQQVLQNTFDHFSFIYWYGHDQLCYNASISHKVQLTTSADIVKQCGRTKVRFAASYVLVYILV